MPNQSIRPSVAQISEKTGHTNQPGIESGIVSKVLESGSFHSGDVLLADDEGLGIRPTQTPKKKRGWNLEDGLEIMEDEETQLMASTVREAHQYYNRWKDFKAASHSGDAWPEQWTQDKKKDGSIVLQRISRSVFYFDQTSGGYTGFLYKLGCRSIGSYGLLPTRCLGIHERRVEVLVGLFPERSYGASST